VKVTKSEEIALWRKFVAGLPEGYLRDTFEGSEKQVEVAILDDVCLPSIDALHRERYELDVEVKELAKRRDELQKVVEVLNRQHDRIAEGLKALRLDAEKIARSACSYASYASDLLKNAAS
jgi:hypothetical protein